MKFTKKTIISCCIAVLAIVAICLMFTPFVNYSKDTIIGTLQSSYTGFQTAFGYSATSGSISVKVLSASFGGIMVFVFFIAIIVLACLNVFVKNAKLNMLFNIIILALAVVATVFLFCAPTGLMFLAADGSSINGYGLGVGAIIDAILMIVVACGAAVGQFVLKD
ncbi:MAG: hypothetical protein IJS83_07220 [Acholeplasmatales bacterium]|nr:hypothetical protein [Acholeplasmatales bacterium]